MRSWSDATMQSLRHPSLEDRVVLITGGGRGFGWLIAEALLEAGAKVVLTATRNPDELADARKQAEAIAGPGRCITVRADITKWDDCTAVVDATIKDFGRIDVLINNAGRYVGEYGGGIATDKTARVPFYDVPQDAFRTIIETNVVGTFNMTKAVMPQFLKQGRGKVFSMSTSLPTMCAPGLSPYGGSKAALEMMHRTWAQELKDKHVDVNILLPGGAADTSMITQEMAVGKVGERAGQAGNSLLPGDIVVPPAVWLCTDATNGLTGERLIAKFWPDGAEPEDALKLCLQPHVDVPAIM